MAKQLEPNPVIWFQAPLFLFFLLELKRISWSSLAAAATLTT